jgi:hypothetical protein
MNRGYRPSQASQAFIDTLTAPLQEIIEEGFYIANTRKLYCPDISIVRGYENAEDQFKLFMIGRELVGDDEFIITGKTVTNCDGYKLISDHQKTDVEGKALAFDYAAWVKGTNYEPGNMALIATCFFEAASNQGRLIEWGGNFRSLSDGSHISLIV